MENTPLDVTVAVRAEVMREFARGQICYDRQRESCVREPVCDRESLCVGGSGGWI